MRFAAMRGSFKQNEKYCSKQNELQKYGREPLGKGGRSDRVEIIKMLTDGASDLDIILADISAYARFRNTIADYRLLVPPTRKDKVEVYLFFGPPGCGKTELTHLQFKDTYRLPIGKNLWFTPSACNAKHILIDDFKSNLALADLLQLLDNNPIEVERKGNHLWFCPDTIIITSNKSPHNWYDFNHRDYEKEALFRRFDNGGVFRFAKNLERVPKPVEIDIHDERNFAHDWPRIIPTVQQSLMPLAPNEICKEHGMKCKGVHMMVDK